MKYLTILKSLALAIVFLLSTLMFNTVVASASESDTTDNCPPEMVKANKDTVQTTYVTKEGCVVTVTTVWCYGWCKEYDNDDIYMATISLSSIKVTVDDCPPELIDPEDYYNTNIIDNAILSLINKSDVQRELEIPFIPNCPGMLCFLKIYDAICYSGWKLKDKDWIIQTCDNEKRRCSLVVTVCYDPTTNKRVVQREMYEQPEPCPSPDCKIKCMGL